MNGVMIQVEMAGSESFMDGREERIENWRNAKAEITLKLFSIESDIAVREIHDNLSSRIGFNDISLETMSKYC